ncbi:MAG: M28 family peptidase, partial [Gemmatimonadota bacterium]
MDLRDFGLNEDELRQLGYKVGPGARESDDGQGDPAAGGEPGPPGARPPRRRASPALRTWIATLVALPIVGWASSLGRGLPAPVPATGPDTAFSSARALAQLVEIAQRPHPTGSPDLVRVRSMLLGRLTALGLQPEVQVTTSYGRDSSFVTSATVRNVVARVPGSASTGSVALLAHYDAAPLSPGAGDDALGVAAVLEAVRALGAAGPLRNDLVVVFTDADEIDLLGSKAFTQQHPWAPDVAATVAFESRGSSGPVLLFESLPGNGALVEAVASSGFDLKATSLTRALRGSALESSNGPAGYRPPNLSLAALGRRAWEGQTRDTRELVDERTLQQGGQELVALARALGGLDLRRDLESPEETYLTLPALGTVHYPAGWNPLISLGLLLVWGAVGLVIRLRRGRRNGIIAGLGLGAASVGLSALAGSTLLRMVGGLHAEYGLLSTAFYHDAPHVLALAFLAVALTSLLYGIVRRWCRWDEVLFGGLAVPLAYVGWLTFATPAAAPAAQWPVGIALVAALLPTVLGPRRGSSVWTWAIVLVLSAAIVVLVVPSLETAALTMTLRSAASLGALLGLSALLLLPLMDWLQRPRIWATPLVGVAAAGALVGLYLPSVQGAVDHPEPTTLVYLTDEAASTDPILRGNETDTDTTTARRVLGQWLTIPGAGEEWARSWVGDPPTGSTDPGVLLVGPDDLYQIAGTGPDTEIAPPAVTLESGTPAGDRRELDLNVRSGLRGEMIGIAIPDDAAEVIGVGNATWPVGGIPTRRLVHWGVPEGGTLHVGLSVPADARQT